MNLKQLLIIMSIATGLCWVAWAIIIFNVNPSEAALPGMSLFYLSFFFALLGSFFLLTFGVRKIFNKLEMDYKLVAVSFRQSFFFAGLIALVLFLQSTALLTWWNLIIIIIALTLLEFLFLSSSKSSI